MSESNHSRATTHYVREQPLQSNYSLCQRATAHYVRATAHYVRATTHYVREQPLTMSESNRSRATTHYVKEQPLTMSDSNHSRATAHYVREQLLTMSESNCSLCQRATTPEQLLTMSESKHSRATIHYVREQLLTMSESNCYVREQLLTMSGAGLNVCYFRQYCLYLISLAFFIVTGSTAMTSSLHRHPLVDLSSLARGENCKSLSMLPYVCIRSSGTILYISINSNVTI